jgi:AcrR family transcriptional regulator
VATTPTPRKRLTAQERREDLVAAATTEFAAKGYSGTSTEDIARRAGISQPYLFRLFGTKKELFLTCVERCFDRVRETFRAAAQGADEGAAFAAMGGAYMGLIADRELLLMQLQTYAAAGDDGIRAEAQRHFQALAEEVAELTGQPQSEVAAFVSQGMALNVVAALGLPADRWLWHQHAAPGA